MSSSCRAHLLSQMLMSDLLIFFFRLLPLSAILMATQGIAQEKPVIFKLLSEPQIRQAYWGKVSSTHSLPYWFALQIEDEQGSPLQHTQVEVRCNRDHQTINQSAEDGWIFGALPKSCIHHTQSMDPQEWSVHIEASNDSISQIKPIRFLPNHLEGSWQISNLTQTSTSLSYVLRNTLRIPHPLQAYMSLRPCLQEEAESLQPVTLPQVLLQSRLESEGIKFTTLSTHSEMGMRRIPLQELKMQVGCYVLSATSKADTQVRLLEARALFWLKGRLKIEIQELIPGTDRLYLSGSITADPQDHTWNHTTLAQALSELELQVKLSPVGLIPSSEHKPPIMKTLAVISPLNVLLDQPASPLQVNWQAQVPFPSKSNEGNLYLSSLHLKESLLYHPKDQLISRTVSPYRAGLFERTFKLLIQPDFWLKILLLWFSLKVLIRWITAQINGKQSQQINPSTRVDLKPIWIGSSLSSNESHQHGSKSDSIEWIELQLFDFETHVPIIHPKAQLYLSHPDLIFHVNCSPQNAPPIPLEGLQFEQNHAGVITLMLHHLWNEEFEKTEELWLWVQLEGYETCVTSIRLENLHKRLKLPIWDHRSAIKRQLNLLGIRHKLLQGFGKQAFENFRSQINDPLLKDWIHCAEALLYSDQIPQADQTLKISWGLAEGILKECVSPYDVRTRRSQVKQFESKALSLSTQLFFLCLLLLFSPFNLHAEQSYTSTSTLNFKSWIYLLSESCQGRPIVKQDITLQELKEVKRMVFLNPYAIPSELLEWVKQGGRTLIALEPDAASRSHNFLARLDLKLASPKQDLTHERVSGIWWSEYALDQGHLLPFLGSSMTHFIEGSSWYQHEIAPAWIDEVGRSLGYRVKVGQGSIFLFGDADALSDDLLSVASNQLSALAFIEWLLHEQTQNTCPLVLVSPAHIHGTSSIHPQDQKNTWQTFFTSLKAWLESLSQWLKNLLGSSYGNQLIVTLTLGLWVVISARKYLSS